ncbi:MAG: glutathione peroxidase [Bacteroidota bacterium]|nr:glutathione peroxidase [Bacteroidota bacterium]
MSFRQKVLRTIYPLITWGGRVGGKGTIRSGNGKAALVPIYDLPLTMNDGSVKNLSAFKGKKILLVNTASDCGFTAQYAQLQRLQEAHINDLAVIGFPANDFKEQEKGTDAEIAGFCKKNYGVSFPLAQKSVVIKSATQNPIFQWLSDPAKNGWNSQDPEWNFSKYLLDENGNLIRYFGPAVEPGSKEMEEAVGSH